MSKHERLLIGHGFLDCNIYIIILNLSQNIAWIHKSKSRRNHFFVFRLKKEYLYKH